MAATTSGFPNASNTGVPDGVVLNASGGITITKAGTVVQGLNITGPVNIQASNVTLKNCKITAATWAVVNIKDGATGVTVQDCEINGVGSNNSGSHGIYGQGTFLRNDIYNVENGITLNGGNTLIQDNYIHNLKASGSPHYDGIQIDGGQSNVTIKHNTIINDHGQTAAVMIDNYFGPISNITVDGNFLSGGGYPLYSDGQFGGGSISGVSFTNNYLGKGQWGYYYVEGNSPKISGNVQGAAGQVPDNVGVPSSGSPQPTTDGSASAVLKIIAGDDTGNVLRGTSADERFYGKGGNDKLNGKGGNDILSGNSGKDAFIFNTKLSSRTNVDKIVNFNTKDDHISLENAIFTKLKMGALSSSMFRVGEKALDTNDHIIYNNKTGALYYDADGNGARAAVKFAVVDNHAKLSIADFFVI